MLVGRPDRAGRWAFVPTAMAHGRLACSSVRPSATRSWSGIGSAWRTGRLQRRFDPPV